METASDQYRKTATEIRKRIIRMIAAGKSCHVGTALSIVDILTALYFRVLNVTPEHPADPRRDRFLLSKGHGASALYATLASRGFCDPKILEGYVQDGGTLTAHTNSFSIPGIELSAGSLGHGLSVGAGMALAGKHDGTPARVFVLLSDGECDEGAVWEAALAAGQFKLDNLVAIIDYNKIQSFGTVQEVMNLEPFQGKWTSFGWAVREVDGHDFPQIVATLEHVPFEPGRPSAVIAHTVKGKGVSFMEHQLAWHYNTPSEEEVRLAVAELDGTREPPAAEQT